jgi:hypothetical protein
MLDKALADSDPATTDVLVMTAKVEPPGVQINPTDELDLYDQQLMTAVVNHAERLGKTVRPLLVPTNNPLHAVLQIAKTLPAQEVVLGASNKYTVEEQLDQISLYWIHLHGGAPKGLTVHVVSQSHDLTIDVEGGNRIPRAADRQAKSVAELRAAGIGVKRVLLAHDGSQNSSDVFEWVVSMLANDVDLDIVQVPPVTTELEASERTDKDQQWAAQIGRAVRTLSCGDLPPGPGVVQILRDGSYDALVLPVLAPIGAAVDHDTWTRYVVQHAPCSVFCAAHPAIPREIVA